ncbi:hypothetical protein QNO07_22405 [Streptomyces sp. 549]|nr:hypothetical protein [Streptomyces sp. 549]MDK1476136.1 hypothetical protein [Streptomyces sp. 549]
MLRWQGPLGCSIDVLVELVELVELVVLVVLVVLGQASRRPP